MSENMNRETVEQQARRRATEASRQGEQQPQIEADQQAEKSFTPTLLGDRRLGDRGNSPVRANVMRAMQSTHGNRAVQRALQNVTEPMGAEDDQLARRIEAASGSGGRLDATVQTRLEAGLGAEMSGVRIHTGGEADRLARSVSAVAFTTGQDIFFREGAYDPHSAEGLKLLAHEATHTVQQAEGSVEGTPSAGGVSISNPSDQYEQAAEQAAERVASGESGSGVDSTTTQGGSTPSAASMASVQRTMIPWGYQQGPNPSNSSYPQGAGQAGGGYYDPTQGAGQAGRVPSQSSGGYGSQGGGQAAGGGFLSQLQALMQSMGGRMGGGMPGPLGSGFPFPTNDFPGQMGGGFPGQMGGGFPFPTNDFPGSMGGGFPGQMGGGFPFPMGGGFPFPTNDFPDQNGGGFPFPMSGGQQGSGGYQQGGYQQGGGGMGVYNMMVGDPHSPNSQIPGYPGGNPGGYPQGGSPGEQPQTDQPGQSPFPWLEPEWPSPQESTESPFPWLEPEWPSPSTPDWPTPSIPGGWPEPSIPDWPTPPMQEQESIPWLNPGTFEQEDPGIVYM